jgi:UDP-N-acetylmuramate--alanine ligase
VADGGNATVIDDYGHHPVEMEATLAAARASFPGRRLVLAFQPHRFTRTAALWRDFADAFVDADRLVVTDVYAAGESPRPGVTGKLVADAVLDAHPRQPVAWMPTLDDVTAYLTTILRPGDLCITLGAGDLTSVPDRVVARLADRS